MIYFLQMRTGGPIKIGYAESASRRIRQLQTGNPTSLICLSLIEGTEENEAQIHERFRHLHARGEWFRPTKELRNYISTLESVVELKAIRPTGRQLRTRMPDCITQTVRLPNEMLSQVDRLANDERRTRGNMLRILLEDALKAREGR